MLGMTSHWWVDPLIPWDETPDGQMLEVTLGVDVLKAVLAENGGMQIWSNPMAYWYDQNFFLLFSTEDYLPPIILTLDFARADFANQDLEGIDLRFAWLNRANFRGTLLKNAQFDFASVTATNFSDTSLEGASFLHAFHKPMQPTLGLSAEMLKSNKVYVDEIPID